MLLRFSMIAIEKVQTDIETVEAEIERSELQLNQTLESDDRQDLRNKLERLGKREEQLRAEKLLLLQSAGASSSSLSLLWLLPGMARQALHLMR